MPSLSDFFNPLTRANDIRAKRVLKTLGEKGKKRIYHYHVRKSGGTSVNYAVISSENLNPTETYNRLVSNIEKRVITSSTVLVGWNKSLIEKGDYCYAFSHRPIHQIDVPADMFTFTIIRNPVNRLISHYKMISKHVEEKTNHPIAKREGKYLGHSIKDFLTNIPKNILLTQLYMFSSDFNVDEAFNNITSLSYFFFTEKFSEGLLGLSSRLGRKLNPMRIRKSKQIVRLRKDERKEMKKLLSSEIILYNRLQKYYKSEIEPYN